MGLRRPIIAMILFACLLGFYLWDVDQVERSQLRQVQEQQVFYHRVEDVVSVTFEGPDSKVTLLRDAAAAPWRITEPGDYGANATIITAYLENLRGAKRQAEFPADDLAKFGLDKPRLRVTIRTAAEGKSESTTLLFGAQPNAMGPVYAMIEGGDRAFTVSEWLVKQSDKKLADLRDRSIATGSVQSARRVEVETIRGVARIERRSATDTEWLVTSAEGDKPIPADRVFVDRILGTLSTGQYLQILDNPTSTTMQLGLDQPALTVRADSATILEVGMRVPEREQFVIRDAQGTIGIIPRSVLADFFRPVAEWSTKRLIWIDPAKLSEVEAASGNATLHLLKDPRGWIFPGMPGVGVRQERVGEYLTALLAMSSNSLVRTRVSDDDLAAYGILAESFELTATDSDGMVQGFRFGRTEASEGLTFVFRKQDRSLWRIDFTAQSRVFKFRRDFEERRLIPDLTVRTAKLVMDVSGTIMQVEKKGAAWQGSIPGENPVVLPPQGVAAFLESFEDLERLSEMSMLGQMKPAAVFTLFEAGATEPYATISLHSKSRRTNTAAFELDGAMVEVDAEQFDVFDEALANLVILIKQQAEAARTGRKPGQK